MSTLSQDFTISATQQTAMTRWALRALSVPVFIVGLEWIVSGANKIVGNFLGPFPAYVSSLQAAHTPLPGLGLAVHFPLIAARAAIATEIAIGVTLVLSAFFFVRGPNRAWEFAGSTALLASAFVAFGLWIVIGRPPFWLTGNGYGSAWPVEFFLVVVSLALTVAIALADPDGTLLRRLIRHFAKDHHAYDRLTDDRTAQPS